MWEWRVREGRPRIWLDESRLAMVREKGKGKSRDEIDALVGTNPPGLALAYVLTGDEETARKAIEVSYQFAEKSGWTQLRNLALCYDWCHDALSAEQKLKFREIFAREGYKRLSQHSMWHSFGHALHSEAFSVGLCALALEPDDRFAAYFLDFLKSRYRDAMRVFDDVFPDGEWPEGFGLETVATGCALRFLWALKTATGDDLMAASPHMKNSVQYILHCSKPNGLVYPGGNNDWLYLNDRDREMLLMLAAEFRDPYAQHFLNHCRIKTFERNRQFAWQDALWYDPSIPERPLEDIPRSRIFRGHGLVIARSGWGWDEGAKQLPASWATFRCGPYFGKDTHYDNNHFEIYYKGELAIDSGRYDDDWGLERDPRAVGRSQLFNYYRRAVAHNTMLVYSDREVMEMGVANDGGQKEMLYVDGVRNEPENYDLSEYSLEEGRMCFDWVRSAHRWKTGEMLAYIGNNLFTYACGDATNAYHKDKVERFVRQFLYVPPDLVVVFDRVVATDMTFRKSWLLHSIAEPHLYKDGRFEIEYGGGRVVCVPVLPEQRLVEKVGGAGKEFLVGGVQYGTGPKASSGRRSPLRFGELPGAWRVEMSPADPSEEHYFLNVMLLTDKGSKALPRVQREDADGDSVAISIGLPYQRAVKVSFARGAAPAAALSIEDHGRTLFDGPMPDRVVPEKGRM